MTTKPNGSGAARNLLMGQHIRVEDRLGFQDLLVVSERLAAIAIDELCEGGEELSELDAAMNDLKAAKKRMLTRIERLQDNNGKLSNARQELRTTLAKLVRRAANQERQIANLTKANEAETARAGALSFALASLHSAVIDETVHEEFMADIAYVVEKHCDRWTAEEIDRAKKAAAKYAIMMGLEDNDE